MFYPRATILNDFSAIDPWFSFHSRFHSLTIRLLTSITNDLLQNANKYKNFEEFQADKVMLTRFSIEIGRYYTARASATADPLGQV